MYPEAGMSHAYHAVSFGNEGAGFDVQGLNLPPYLPEQNYTPPGATPSQAPSAGEVTSLQSAATTPSSHPAYIQSSSPGFRPCDGPGAYSQHLGYSADSLFPKFPPQSIDIPDITYGFPTATTTSPLVCNGQLPSSNETCAPTTNFTYQQLLPQHYHQNNLNVFPHPGSILPPRGVPGGHLLQTAPPCSTVDGSQLNLHTLVTARQQQQQQQQHQQQQGMMDANKPGSNTNSPVRETDDSSSDDSLPLAQLALRQTAPAASSPPSNTTATGAAPKKPKPPKRKKKKVPTATLR